MGNACRRTPSPLFRSRRALSLGLYGLAMVEHTSRFPNPLLSPVTDELTAVISIQNHQRNGGRVLIVVIDWITCRWAPFFNAILCIHPRNTPSAVREWTIPPIRTARQSSTRSTSTKPEACWCFVPVWTVWTVRRFPSGYPCCSSFGNQIFILAPAYFPLGCLPNPTPGSTTSPCHNDTSTPSSRSPCTTRSGGPPDPTPPRRRYSPACLVVVSRQALPNNI